MEDVAIVILGISSDLAKKKLIPAIYQLVKQGNIGKIALIGVARSDYEIEKIIDESLKSVSNKNVEIINKIKNEARYVKVNFENEEEYVRISDLLKNAEEKGIKNKLFYLATLPEHFVAITKGLVDNGLVVNNKKSWTRVLYEKPFGKDLKSAKEIDKIIDKLIGEEAVYRVDHYLGKKSVSEIIKFRFESGRFESLWDNKNIESVQIVLDENFGINGRGSYYDKYGAIKDVVQNHALQILSLIAMEEPKDNSDEAVRDEKTEVLNKIRAVDSILGQYEGYKNEKNVSENSNTETFCALKLEINDKRWKGVPFFVRAGKNFKEKQGYVRVKFKDSSSVVIKVSPEKGLFFEKEGNSEKIEVGPSNMSGEAYEVVLEEAVKGEKKYFVRNDEIENAWKIVEGIDKSKLRVYDYEAGSNGPKEFEEWSKKNRVEWKN